MCLRRFDEARANPSRGLTQHAYDRELSRIASWLETTETGDRAELSDLPEDAAAWREVASSSETRIGAGCEHFERCFVTRMRREAEDAQIVVVNHHLFLADLALRSGPRGAHASVIPAYDAVIFDEAHQLEDVATDFFGVRVSSARVEALLRDAERSLVQAKALDGGSPARHLRGARGTKAPSLATAAARHAGAGAGRRRGPSSRRWPFGGGGGGRAARSGRGRRDPGRPRGAPGARSAPRGAGGGGPFAQ